MYNYACFYLYVKITLPVLKVASSVEVIITQARDSTNCQVLNTIKYKDIAILHVLVPTVIKRILLNMIQTWDQINLIVVATSNHQVVCPPHRHYKSNII